MANTLGYYNPVFYAQEALIALENAMGMASRVYRGYEAERRSFNKGDTINVTRPSVLTVANAPATAEDLAVGSVQISLNQWKEVKFKLSDKELAYTTERIIEDHISPAAYALADNVDAALCGLYADIPHYRDSTGVAADILNARKQLFDLGVPLHDQNNMHIMVDSATEALYLAVDNFILQTASGDASGLLRGNIGKKYGFEIFANQNVKTHTKGTVTDGAGAIDLVAGYAIGDTAIHLDALGADTETILKGDVLAITGDATGNYAVTTDTVVATADMDVVITPGLRQAVLDNAVTTFNLDTHAAMLAFHRDAFCLAMAPLPEMGKELGAKVATVTDPRTGISIRSRVYYVGNSSEVHVALDILYGVKTLNPDMACRLRGA